jgi:hypothetical protein
MGSKTLDPTTSVGAFITSVSSFVRTVDHFVYIKHTVRRFLAYIEIAEFMETFAWPAELAVTKYCTTVTTSTCIGTALQVRKCTQ